MVTMGRHILCEHSLYHVGHLVARHAGYVEGTERREVDVAFRVHRVAFELLPRLCLRRYRRHLRFDAVKVERNGQFRFR